MAAKPINKQGTRSSSNGDQINPSEFEDIIQMDQSKTMKDQKDKRKNKLLGEIAWEQMFDGDNLELPATNFMDCLKQAITHEQFQQITNDMIRGMDIMKEGFCARDHYTLQEAKDQLHSLLTDIMMDDAGYILDKTINESKKEMAHLKKIKIRLDHYKSIASSKKKHKDRVAKTLEFAIDVPPEGG